MLVNEKLANLKVATIYGEITFNDKGETKELTVEQRKNLGKLPGFKFVEEPKKEEPKKAEPKKAPTKKAPVKKTTKKEESK